MSSELTGVKHDTGKNRLDLIPPEAIEALGWVLTHGAEKYGDNNWRGGIKYSRVYGATLRHLTTWAKGEERDKESAMPHLWHALCELAFLVAFEAHPDLYLNDMYAANNPITEEDISGLTKAPPAEKKRIYLSHPIRGLSGTKEEVARNNDIARGWGEILRKHYPDIDWYVPAEHDEILQELLKMGRVDITDILTADFMVVDRCDGLVAIPWCASVGIEKEILFATDRCIPVFRATDDFIAHDLVDFIRSL